VEKWAIQSVAAERIIAFVEAVAADCKDIDTIAAYIYKKPVSKLKGAPKGHASRAGAMAELLGFVVRSNDDEWHLSDPREIDLDQWDDESKRVLFREHIQEFRPFVRFWDFIRRGMSSEDAAVRTSAVLSLEPPVIGNKNVLAAWGEFAGILVRDAQKVSLAQPAEVVDIEDRLRVLAGIEQALGDKLSARAWLERLLGTEAFDALDADIVDDLITALMSYQSNPDTALREAGRALEDYLKIVAKCRGVSLVDEKGRSIDQLSQLAQLLRTNKVIADKHVNVLRGLESFVEYDVLQGFAAFRNMPSHGKNVEDWERWELGEEIALCITVQIVLTIRSLWCYAVKHKRTY